MRQSKAIGIPKSSVTIDVSHQEIDHNDATDSKRGAPARAIPLQLISTSDLAREIGCHANKVCEYKSKLIKLGHKAFRNYNRGAALTKPQADTIREYRRLLMASIRGKILRSTILRYSSTHKDPMKLIREHLESNYGISGEALDETIGFIQSTAVNYYQ